MGQGELSVQPDHRRHRDGRRAAHRRSNPRKEAAILNARIRKRWRAGKFPIGVIGPKADLTYAYDYLGAGPETLADISRHSFADALRQAERPMVLIGAAAFARADGSAIASLAPRPLPISAL